MCRYYEHVLEKMDEEEANEIIQDSEFEEDDDELSTRLATSSDSIH